MARKQIARAGLRVADPSTMAALDGAPGEERGSPWEAQMNVLFAEMKALLAGRLPRDLVGNDAVAFVGMKAHFDALALEKRSGRRFDPADED